MAGHRAISIGGTACRRRPRHASASGRVLLSMRGGDNIRHGATRRQRGDWGPSCCRSAGTGASGITHGRHVQLLAQVGLTRWALKSRTDTTRGGSNGCKLDKGVSPWGCDRLTTGALPWPTRCRRASGPLGGVNGSQQSRPRSQRRPLRIGHDCGAPGGRGSATSLPTTPVTVTTHPCLRNNQRSEVGRGSIGHPRTLRREHGEVRVNDRDGGGVTSTHGTPATLLEGIPVRAGLAGVGSLVRRQGSGVRRGNIGHRRTLWNVQRGKVRVNERDGGDVTSTHGPPATLQEGNLARAGLAGVGGLVRRQGMEDSAKSLLLLGTPRC